MTASRKINSRIEPNRIDEIRGNITVDEDDLVINENNFHRQSCIHRMATGQNATKKIPEFLSGHVPTHREPTQPQNMTRQPLRDTTLPVLENNDKRASNDHKTPIKILAEAIAGIASH